MCQGLVKVLREHACRGVAQRIQQADFLDGDDCLACKSLEQITVGFRKRAGLWAFQVQHTLQPATSTDEGYCEFGAHLQSVVERVVNSGPRQFSHVSDDDRLLRLCYHAHHAGDVDRECLDRGPSKILSRNSRHHQRTPLLVH